MRRLARYRCRAPRELVHDRPCAGCERWERDLRKVIASALIVAGFIWWKLA